MTRVSLETTELTSFTVNKVDRELSKKGYEQAEKDFYIISDLGYYGTEDRRANKLLQEAIDDNVFTSVLTKTGIPKITTKIQTVDFSFGSSLSVHLSFKVRNGVLVLFGADFLEKISENEVVGRGLRHDNFDKLFELALELYIA